MRRSSTILAALTGGTLLVLATVASADIYRTVNPETGVMTFTNIRPGSGRFDVVSRDPVPVEVAPAGRTVRNYSPVRRSSTEFARDIDAAASAYGVDPALIRAVISAESGHNPYAHSRAGALGLMQLMPDTAIRYGVTNRLDPVQNIHGGARYLRDLLKMFNNDLQLTVAAYNAGEEAVMRHGRRIPPYRETMDYVPRVLKYYRQYRGPA